MPAGGTCEQRSSRPAVRARCDCDGRALGAVVDARLAEADPAAPRVRFPV